MSKTFIVKVEEASFEEFSIEADTQELAEEEAFNLSSYEEPTITSIEELE